MTALLGLLTTNHAKLRRAARWIGGGLARTGRKEHPAEAAVVAEVLHAQYAAATDDATRKELISALGKRPCKDRTIRARCRVYELKPRQLELCDGSWPGIARPIEDALDCPDGGVCLLSPHR